jgi:hypothetical protein
VLEEVFLRRRLPKTGKNVRERVKPGEDNPQPLRAALDEIRVGVVGGRDRKVEPKQYENSCTSGGRDCTGDCNVGRV